MRGTFHGVRQIVYFNWPRYAAGGVVVLAALFVLRIARLPHAINDALVGIVLLTGWWSFASLIASHWVYDRSELMRWDWLKRELPHSPRRWLNIHAGLDESSAVLRILWPNATGEIVDIFTANQMTEGSIRRARADTGSPRANYDNLPFGENYFDSIFLFFVAHELRTPATRQKFFGEAGRILAREGCVVLVEHLRDLPNFAAYGPGFTHFHSLRTWHTDIAAAGLAIKREFCLTSFVRVFLLRKI